MKLDANEKEPLESVERGEWNSARGKRERTRYAHHAKATFRKEQVGTLGPQIFVTTDHAI